MLFVYDNLVVASGSISQFSLTVDTSQASLHLKLKVSIAWTDIPGSSTSAKTLVNDIDLLVVTPGHVAYWGNGQENGDRLHTKEQVGE